MPDSFNFDFTEWFDTSVRINSELVYNIIATIAVIISLWVIRLVLVRLMMRGTEDIRSRYIFQKTATYISIILGIFLITRIWFSEMGELTTFLGLLSAGIAIALKDIVVNVAAWVFLVWVRPLTVGDRIQIGEHRGDVIDIALFHFTLMEIGNWVDSDQSTGRIIKVPNGRIFSEPLANYSQGFQYIWNEVPVLVTFESDWRKAKDILFDIARRRTEDLSGKAEKRVREASMRFMISYSKLTPTVYTSVKDCGIMLTIRYLTEPRRRRTTEEVIWEDILTSFAVNDDIDFAYPTQRFFDNSAEGKPGTQMGAQNVSGAHDGTSDAPPLIIPPDNDDA
jgi:small-conductance mechanosensitive channel